MKNNTSRAYYLLILFVLLFAGLRTNAADCSSHYTKKCISNISYWYNSCGALEGINQNCSLTNQICQNNQCSDKPQTNINTTTQDTVTTTTNQQTTAGSSNQQTTNSLSGQENKTTNQPQSTSLTVSLFGKLESEPMQWEKYINAKNNDKIYFLLIIKNTSTDQLNNTIIKVQLPDNITYNGNLKIDDVDSAGNIISGINLGTIPPSASKSIIFSATVQTQNVSGAKQVIATSESNNNLNSDYLTVSVAPIIKTTNQNPKTTTGNSTTPTENKILNFLKHYYVWIIIIIVLIILFIVIYRKLSSNV